ncbi:MAG: hypothetical protein ACRDNG_12935 [Gaiellaceae bacterium]
MSPATALALQLPTAFQTPVEGFDAHLLNVTFEAPGGELRSAIGGRESVPEAIAAARDELPAGV